MSEENVKDPAGMVFGGELFMLDSMARLPAAAALMIGLDDREYASIFLSTADHRRLTVIGDDVSYIEALTELSSAMLAGLRIPRELFPIVKDGWPDDWLGENVM